MRQDGPGWDGAGLGVQGRVLGLGRVRHSGAVEGWDGVGQGAWAGRRGVRLVE